MFKTSAMQSDAVGVDKISLMQQNQVHKLFLLQVDGSVKVSVERFPDDDFIFEVDLIRMSF